MTSTPPESDLRRQSLLTQLAAILQVDAGTVDGPGKQGDAAADALFPRTLPSAGGLRTSDHSLPLSPGTAQADIAAPSPLEPQCQEGEFLPIAPGEFAKLRLSETEVESLILKFLLSRQNATGLMSQQIGILFCVCEKILHAVKADRLVVFKAAKVGDYVYELTESGTHRARKFAETCGYFGTAPVSWKIMPPVWPPSRCKIANRASTTSAARSPT